MVVLRYLHESRYHLGEFDDLGDHLRQLGRCLQPEFLLRLKAMKHWFRPFNDVIVKMSYQVLEGKELCLIYALLPMLLDDLSHHQTSSVVGLGDRVTQQGTDTLGVCKRENRLTSRKE